MEDQRVLAQSAEVSWQEESDGEGGAPAGDLQVPGQGEGGPQPGDGGPGEAGDRLELVHHGQAWLAVVRAEVEPEGEAEERIVRRRSVSTDYLVLKVPEDMLQGWLQVRQTGGEREDWRGQSAVLTLYTALLEGEEGGAPVKYLGEDQWEECGEYSQLTVGSVPGQQLLDDDVPERERHLDPAPHVQAHHLLEISQLPVPDGSLHHHGQTPLLRAEEGGGGGSEGEGDEVREDLEEGGEREESENCSHQDTVEGRGLTEEDLVTGVVGVGQSYREDGVCGPLQGAQHHLGLSV